MYFFIFVIGLAFGSFALAMVDRMKTKRDWVSGRSECDFCKNQLEPRDLVPVFSWILQRGKCRFCKRSLSPAYPAVELFSGLVFLLSYMQLSHNGALEISRLGLWFIALILLSALLVFDVRWFLLPNKLAYPLILVSVVDFLLYMNVVEGGISLWSFVLLAGSLAISAGIFAVLYGVSKGRWLGDGDIRLGVAMGFFLQTPAKAWLALFMASVIGIIYYLVAPLFLKSSTKKTKKSTIIPFGPSLIVALIIVKLYGQLIIDWYLNNFL